LLTFEQIKELLELVAARQLAGLEIERSGFRLKIDGRQGEPAVTAGVDPPPSPRAAAPPPPSTAPPPPAAEPAPSLPDDAQVVTSPIVGTFYRAPAPEAEAFVEVGKHVSRGQVLCIVEAMKLMNEIESDLDGTILEIYPQNAQAVEFGEPLFAIRPA
jgi:acetyl-CoA carboxylase biotin carboxyl carrier protein